MGFLGKVKRYFDAGGLKYEIESADTFHWDDDQVPFTLVVTGHESIDRVIANISIEFEEDEMANSKNDSSDRSRRLYSDRIEGPFAIPAGETVRIDLGIELPSSTGVSRMIGGAIEMLTTGSISFGRRRYVIQATPRVEGMKIAKSATGRIRSESRETA